MTKELRKRIWETRDNVNELIFEIEEIGDVLDKLTVKETLRDISELLSNIIQEIIQEGKNNEKKSKA